MAEEGNGMVQITSTLNDEGILSPKGKLWGKTSVHAILINESHVRKTLLFSSPQRVESGYPSQKAGDQPDGHDVL